MMSDIHTGEYLGGTWPRRKSACRWNNACCSPFVRWSAILIVLSIRSRCIRLRSTHSQRENFLMSICLVRGVGFWALPISLQEFDASKCKVGACHSHGPYQLANAGVVCQLLFLCKLCPVFRVRVSCCGIEFSIPGWVGQEWRGPVSRGGVVLHPNKRYFLQTFSMNVQLEILM
jgi:hypothetical protein